MAVTGTPSTPPPHRRVLIDEQLAEYQARGFLTVRGIFEPGLLQRLIDTTGRLWNEGRELQTKTSHYDLAEGHSLAYSAPVIDSRHRNRMVRGEPSPYARVEAGMIEMPPDFSAGYSGIFSIQTPEGRGR